jgi:hypothetical protein
VKSETSYDVEENLAAGIERHMLQQRAEDQTGTECGDVQPLLLSLFQ